MFERYTERARRVLFFARYEASQLGSLSIETEHLLLGLLREGKGLASRLFARAHVTVDDIRRQIEGQTMFREKVSTSVEIPFSAETKRVLQFAADEADRLLHNYIGTEHLLLALLREERCVAATILRDAGLSLTQVRTDIQTILAERAPRGREEAALDEDERYPEHPLSRMPVPLYVPSTIVHISFNRYPRHGQSHLSVGPHHWLAVDAPLRYIVARLHHVRDEQVTLDGADTPPLDVALVLPTDRASSEPVETLVLHAISEQLRLKMTRETTADGDRIIVAPAR